LAFFVLITNLQTFVNTNQKVYIGVVLLLMLSYLNIPTHNQDRLQRYEIDMFIEDR